MSGARTQRYDGSKWDQVALDEPLEDEDHDAYLKRIGFDPDGAWILAPSVDLWPAVRVTPALDESRWLIDFTIGQSSRYSEVLCTTFPAMLEVAERLQGMQWKAYLLDLAEQWRQPAERLFRAHHGHEIDDVCRTCDPIMWLAKRDGHGED